MHHIDSCILDYCVSLVLCVSDRSGNPRAGNPAEEYSGERDGEALRTGTPKPSTPSPPLLPPPSNASYVPS